jgi:hypothetical protein
MILEDRIRDGGTRTDMYEQVRRGALTVSTASFWI